MEFSTDCLSYLKAHSAISATENQLLDFIKNNIPTSTRLDWTDVLDKTEIQDAHRGNLKNVILFLMEHYQIEPDEEFYILNINDMFPLLESKLSDWLVFIEELDFADTLFIRKNMDFIMHWDFYGQFYAKKLA